MFLKNYGPCIAACYDCATICDRCAVACSEGEDPQAMARCISLVMDCAQMCRTAAALMSHRSEFIETICEACADVSGACAEECRQHGIKQCRQAAEACVWCANLCREIVRQANTSLAFA